MTERTLIFPGRPFMPIPNVVPQPDCGVCGVSSHRTPFSVNKATKDHQRLESNEKGNYCEVPIITP